MSGGSLGADQPLSGADTRLLLECGVPREAVRADLTLDLALLRELGWEVSSGSLTPPDTEHYRDLAQHNAQRAIDDPLTRRRRSMP
ncbi:MAG: hypothetical protein QM733_17905 [Ilumatobacteraceae bacterium]